MNNIETKPNNLPIETGWYAARFKQDNSQHFLRIRIHDYKQELVVDAVGYDLKFSEELWRYKDGWEWSDKLMEISN